MTWWNLFGLNPTFKDFIEKYPNKTLLGLGWGFYWRFVLVGLSLELILVVTILTISGVLRFFFH